MPSFSRLPEARRLQRKVDAQEKELRVFLFVGLVQRPANSSVSSFQTAQGHAFRKLFYAAGAVTASMR